MDRLINLGAALISSPSNLFYFTEYENADAKLLINAGAGYYFTDSRYFEDVRTQNLPAKILDIANFEEFILDSGIKELCIENSLTHYETERLKELGVNSFSFISEQIDSWRAVKTESELEKIIAAQKITDKSFSQILSYIKEGMTETELARDLAGVLYRNGAQRLAFDSIVAFGKNSSKPHARPGQTKLTSGMNITLDFGAKFQGYCSDMTRTVFFGEVSSQTKKVYQTVLTAQETALNNIRPNLTGKECDSFARDYFERQSLGKYFLHSLGHSLGIDIHESPSFSQKCGVAMAKNMVMSVEPGLYFENSYGIRIEDIIYFTETGVINLTNSPKNMIII